MYQDLNLLEEGQISNKVTLLEQDAGYVITDQNIIKKTLKEAKEFYKDTHHQDLNAFDKIPSLTVDCILQKANTRNRNNRIYPKPILSAQVDKYQHVITNNNSFSETDHPDTPTVSLKRESLSHLVRETWWEGDTLMGKIEIITSPRYHETGAFYCIGDFIAHLLDRKYKLGISSRGLGSVRKQNGLLYVQNDFELICFDIVSSPSTSDAYLSNKLEKEEINESFYTKNNDIFQEKLKKFLKK